MIADVCSNTKPGDAADLPAGFPQADDAGDAGVVAIVIAGGDMRLVPALHMVMMGVDQLVVEQACVAGRRIDHAERAVIDEVITRIGLAVGRRVSQHVGNIGDALRRDVDHAVIGDDDDIGVDVAPVQACHHLSDHAVDHLQRGIEFGRIGSVVVAVLIDLIEIEDIGARPLCRRQIHPGKQLVDLGLRRHGFRPGHEIADGHTLDVRRSAGPGRGADLDPCPFGADPHRRRLVPPEGVGCLGLVKPGGARIVRVGGVGRVVHVVGDHAVMVG